MNSLLSFNYFEQAGVALQKRKKKKKKKKEKKKEDNFNY